MTYTLVIPRSLLAGLVTYRDKGLGSIREQILKAICSYLSRLGYGNYIDLLDSVYIKPRK